MKLLSNSHLTLKDVSNFSIHWSNALLSIYVLSNEIKKKTKIISMISSNKEKQNDLKQIKHT